MDPGAGNLKSQRAYVQSNEAILLFQIGEEDEGEENAAHELATFTNEAFSLEDNDK